MARWSRTVPSLLYKKNLLVLSLLYTNLLWWVTKARVRSELRAGRTVGITGLEVNVTRSR